MEVEEESKETFTTKSADNRLIAEADLASKRSCGWPSRRLRRVYNLLIMKKVLVAMAGKGKLVSPKFRSLIFIIKIFREPIKASVIPFH